MRWEPPTYTDEEILADMEMKAAHWELEATLNPEVAAVCLDYAKHIRTMIECLRMDMVERDVFATDDRSLQGRKTKWKRTPIIWIALVFERANR